MRIARPGPGERLAPHHRLGQTELEADRAHFVLEQRLQGLDQLELQVVGQAADVVVALDVRGSGAAARLDDVGVERALHEELDVAPPSNGPSAAMTSAATSSNVRMNSVPMILRLVSGSVTSRERVEELLRRVDDHEPDAGGGDVVALHLLALALAQQPVVDEHAGELITDRAVHEGGRDRGVDAARETAQHVTVADAGADVGDRVVDDVGGRPRRRDPGTVVEEPLEHGLTVRGVQDLGVPLQPEAATVGLFEGGDLGAVGGAGDPEARRGDDHRVAVRHPHRLLRRLAREQHGARIDGGGGAPELGAFGALDRAAERLGHHLEPVTDSERRHPGVEQGGVDAGRTVRVDAGRATGQDDRRRLLGQHLGDRHLVRNDLAVDVGLAHAARDQLGVLRAEVDDEDERGLRRVAGRLTHPPMVLPDPSPIERSVVARLLLTGPVVVGVLLGGGVDFFGREQDGRRHRDETGGVDGERDRGGRHVVGQLDDGVHVDRAEREVERVDRSAELLDHGGDRFPARGAALRQQTFVTRSGVVGGDHVSRHGSPCARGGRRPRAPRRYWVRRRRSLERSATRRTRWRTPR